MEDELGSRTYQHLALLASSGPRNAYARLVVEMAVRGFSPIVRVREGGKNDVHFQAKDGTRPFSFIVNKNDLNFYFRASAEKPSDWPEGIEVTARPDVNELRVRIVDENAAKEVLARVR